MWRFSCGVVLCGALIGGLATPAFADEGEAGGAASVLVGGFSVGDGLEAMIEEREGSLRFQLPIGGLSASWDSRRTGGDRSGLGPGWNWAIGSVDTQGGVRVFPASGGVYEADASVTSGLRGYEVGDVRFEQREGVLPARDGVAEARAYSYVLAEAGGVTTYFSAEGDPLASIDLAGDRTDWLWSDDVAHRLAGTVDAYGVRTELVWDDAARSIVVRPAANVGAEPRAVWTVQLGTSAVESVTDPLDRATTLTYDEAGLVTLVSGVSGSSTEVSWHSADDGIARVDELTTVDPEGTVLSSRTWEPSGSLPTGWPVTQQPGGAQFETVLSDGPSRVVSTYSALGLLTHRELQVSTASGSSVVQTSDFTYPDTNGVEPANRPGNWSRPTATEVTYLDDAGASRSVAESSSYDEFGRVVEHTAADGSVTSTEYDPTVADDLGVPIGLVVRETVQTPDGLTRERLNTLNDRHSAVTGTEVRESRPGGEPAIVERIDYEVDDGGFVREQRVHPQGDATASPVVTRWAEQIDLADGTVTLAETIAAGTAAEATTSQVTSLTHGSVLEEVDALGNRTIAEHDALGRPTAVTDPAGRTTTTAYESERGRSTVTTTAPDGVERTEVHDALGRVVEVTDNIATADGGRAMPTPGHVRRAESREYAPAQVTVTDAWGTTSTATHDVFGRVIASEGATGAVKVTEYDDTAGTNRSGVTPTGDLADAQIVREQQRDTLGNVVATTDTRADGADVTSGSSTFDGLGRVTFTTDGTSDSHIGYDAFGREASQRTSPAASPTQGEGTPAPDAVTASLEFDAFGRSTGKTMSSADEQRAGYSRVLDELGRTVEQTDQSGAWTRQGYTVDGLVAWSETSAGQRTEVGYDPITRARLSVRVTSPSAPEVGTVYHYDEVTGRLAWVADAADPEQTRIEYEYDAFGNVTKVTYPDDGAIRSQYDEHGRKTVLVDVAGNRTDYRYTETGLLESVVQHDESGTELASAAYTYDDLGRITALDRGNGLVTEYTFTAADEIAAEQTTQAGRVLDERRYTYDESGALSRRVDTTRDSVDAEPVTTSTEYVYDAFRRLIASKIRDGEATDATITRETEYEVTLAGDIAAETVRTAPGSDAEATTTRTFGYSARSELTMITTASAEGVSVAAQRYDAAGNLLESADGETYTFDAADRLVGHTAADGTQTQTDYWADGTRKLQRSGGATTTFHWDGATLLNETVSVEGATETAAADDLGIASYLIGANRHARTVHAGTVAGAQGEPASATSYYGTDRHGNVTALTDGAGQVTSRYSYTDYGSTTRASGTPDGTEPGISRNPFQYAGEHTDRDGTQHLATRSYDHDTMQFISMDSAALENRFAYGDLNPIMHVDPTGRSSAPDIFNWTVAAVGVVFALASLAGAIYAAAVSLHGLAVLSVTAVAANAGAAAAATAVAVDSTIRDFMDDETASMVTFGELLLPVGAALAGAAIAALSLAPRAAKAATTLKTTSFFTRKYTKEWATSSDGQKSWSKLKSKLTQEPRGNYLTKQAWFDDLHDSSGLYRQLVTKHTGPAKDSEKLVGWLSEGEWLAQGSPKMNSGHSMAVDNYALVEKSSKANQHSPIYIPAYEPSKRMPPAEKPEPGLNVGSDPKDGWKTYDVDPQRWPFGSLDAPTSFSTRRASQ
jgi:RHS repeat-associated protein